MKSAEATLKRVTATQNEALRANSEPTQLDELERPHNLAGHEVVE